MNIYIYDDNLTNEKIVTTYSSFVWEFHFIDLDKFSFTMPNILEAKNVKTNKYICYNGVWGFITVVENDGFNVNVSGYSLKGLLLNYVYGYDLRDTDASKCNKILFNAIHNLSLINKVIVMGIETGLGVTVPNDTDYTIDYSQYQYNSIYSLVQDICLINYWDYSITKASDENKFVFEASVPSKKIDYTFKDSIISWTYTDDTTRTINTLYHYSYISSGTHYLCEVVKDGDGTVKSINQATNPPSGLNVREAMYSSDIRNDGYNGIYQYAKAYFTDNSTNESIDIEVTDEGYQTDWKLGSLVTATVNICGEIKTFTNRITAVEEVFEPANHSIKITLGNRQKSRLEKLLRERGEK